MQVMCKSKSKNVIQLKLISCGWPDRNSDVRLHLSYHYHVSILTFYHEILSICVRASIDVFLAGGLSRTVNMTSQTLFDDLWKFSLQTLSWRKFSTNLPQPVFFHSADICKVRIGDAQGHSVNSLKTGTFLGQTYACDWHFKGFYKNIHRPKINIFTHLTLQI